jgi:hypothetical protein
MNARYKVPVSAIVLLNGLALLAAAGLLLSLNSLKSDIPLENQPEAVAVPTPPSAAMQPSALATPDALLAVVQEQPDAVAVPTPPPGSVRVESLPVPSHQGVSNWHIDANPTAWRGELPLIVAALIAVSPTLWGWLRRAPSFHVHPFVR